MKRRAALILAVTAAAWAVPAAASAGSFTGVLVAKDTARGAVVTASAHGVVRTVRSTAAVKSLRVGHRVTVRAARKADGTFTAQGVRATGRAARATMRGIVVRHGHGRYLLSAGSSVIALRDGDRNDDSKPGDKVVVDVTLAGGNATASDVETVGHASAAELEGIFLGRAADGAIRLAVEHRGEVLVAVPAGVTVPDFKPGDEVELDVTLGENGAFTLVRARGDDEEDDDHGEVEVHGKVTALAANAISVQPEHGGAAITCAIPAGTSLGSLAVGDRVELKCVDVGGTLTLRKLESDDEDDDGGDDGDD